MRTKSKKRFLPLVCLLIVSALFGMVAAYTGVKAGDSTVDISTETYTKYFMTVPIKGLATKIKLSEKEGFVCANVGCKAFSRADCTFTVILVFPNVKYKDPVSGIESGVLVSRLTTVNMPAYMSTGTKIVFNEDLKINIRESYYNYFKQGDYDFSQILITLLKNTYTRSVYDSSTNSYTFTISDISLSTEEVNTDPNDPNSPDFELGDNGGVNPSPLPTESKSLLQIIYEFLSKLFKWQLSYKYFCIIFWCIVGVIGLALIMSLWRAIFGHR